MSKEKITDAMLLVLNMERGALETRNVEDSRSWKGRRNGFFEKEHSPAETLVLFQQDPCWTSNLQNHKIRNLFCFSH